MTHIILTSSRFENGGPIPRRYTGDGDDASPPLAWSAVPAGTIELALIADDPDAPTAEPWVHWVLYKIPGGTTSLPEKIAPARHLAALHGALQGKNSWPNGIGYRGPAPPKGHGVHHYHFRLYALDTELNIEAGADKTSLISAMQGHIVAEGELIGTYER